MRLLRLRVSKVAWVFVLFLVGPMARAGAQNAVSELRGRLVGQPLYLRGLWKNDKLEFDGTGHPVGKAEPGSLTLSGIDVQGVDTNGRTLWIRGQRVALVVDAEGRMQRKAAISSTTSMAFSLRRGEDRKFEANEPMMLTVHADEQGSFEAALKAILADGLAELATSAPSYWKCYAEGYFVSNAKAANAETTVDACVKRSSLAPDAPEEGVGDFVPPRLLQPGERPFSRTAAEMGVSGTSTVHFTVSKHGIPVGFQIVRAVGAGLDEATLTTVYNYQIQPATLAGVAVAADSDFSMSYTVEK